MEESASDEETDCRHCIAGKYSSVIASVSVNDCIDCISGKYINTTASNQETDCISCIEGTYSTVNGSDSVQTCIDCIVGKYVEVSGSDEITDCIDCPVDTFVDATGTGALSDCVACAPFSGTSNATGRDNVTACVCFSGYYGVFPTNDTCTACSAGRVDSDLNPSTRCVDCGLGFYAPAVDTVCVGCLAGRSDHDSNPATECRNCATGSFADVEATLCVDCVAGQYDHDISADTPCTACSMGKYSDSPRASGDCRSCEPGRFQPSVGANSQDLCYPCAVGQFSANASSLCETCLDGTFDEDSDPSTPCKRCDDIEGLQCAGTVVSPAPGYYMDLQVCPEVRPNPEEGPPPLGCEYEEPSCDGEPSNAQWVNPDSLESEEHPGCVFAFNSQGKSAGSCPSGCVYFAGALTTLEAGDLSSLSKCDPMIACIGGLYGQANCMGTYYRDRCATCKKKHYRLEGECFECGESIAIEWLILAFIGVFLATALAADTFLSKVKNVSQLLAPALILMTFFQTLALLLQVSLAWPPQLKELMTYMSFINFNVELARKCTGNSHHSLIISRLCL